MAMSAALAQVFSFDRTRARFRSDRIEQHDGEDSTTQQPPPAIVASAEGEAVTSPPASPRQRRSSARRGTSARATAAARGLTTVGLAPENSGDNRRLTLHNTTPASSSPSSPTEASNAASSPVDVEAGISGLNSGGAAPAPSVIPLALPRAASLTLAELEEERELARRRSSLCILLASFVLFRLWVSAIQEGDFGLMLLCLVGTSWTARWISYNREREEELDRRISNYIENQENGGESTTTLDRGELRMLSFQAQLALAIMESQRQMMQGGYGAPDGGELRSPGVSDEAKSRWTHLKYKPGDHGGDEARSSSNKAGYGSVTQKDNKDASQEDGPHCSICLCEYEEGDDVVKLPCGHLYHDDCISSWTSNHVKCPLCNYDLESANGGAGGSLADALAPEIV